MLALIKVCPLSFTQTRRLHMTPKEGSPYNNLDFVMLAKFGVKWSLRDSARNLKWR